MQTSTRRLGLILAAAAGLAAATPALAHHSFAMFDMAKEQTVTGTVTDFQWTNPHTWIWLEVPIAGGSGEQWGVEGMSPNFLERRGWSKNTLRRGDKISVVLHPVKNGKPGGSFVRVTLPDGKVMDMMGGSGPVYPPATPAPKS
jgi:hypothetical protein